MQPEAPVIRMHATRQLRKIKAPKLPRYYRYYTVRVLHEVELLFSFPSGQSRDPPSGKRSQMAKMVGKWSKMDQNGQGTRFWPKFQSGKGV